MRRLLFLLLWVGLLSGCAPTSPRQQLPADCRAEQSLEQLLTASWLQQANRWRLRQSALLELGPQKIALEGFLRLDLQQRSARLLAMNELGLVLFDLELDAAGEQLHRAVPQLQQVEGFAAGVAQSLRQIFFSPQPQLSDQLQQLENRQRLWRLLPGGSVGFIFDCRGDLRKTRQVADGGDWQVIYEQYREFDGSRLPEQIVLNDYRHALKLSLWLREVKVEQ